MGQYVAWPLTAGEPVLARAVRHARSGISLTGDITVPDGFRAVAVPVQPAGAVGGMLAPGDHVDAYATPLAGHQSTSASLSSASRPPGPDAVIGDGTAVLGRDLLVLQLRSDQGQPLDAATDQSVHGLNFGVGKLGSVVIAVPADEVSRYASAAASTFRDAASLSRHSHGCAALSTARCRSSCRCGAGTKLRMPSLRKMAPAAAAT